ncbi:MAG: serine/threonine protein kinase [Streptosporangiales bacterium]|nr:serine/threonine protein kinase [Streptosporangiales bacterium]
MPLQQGDPPQIGRYSLSARLGAGGMGVVYLGHRDDGKQVAVKVLRPEYADDQEFRARFRREVQAMVRVRNRYTVQVLDADTDGQVPFLVTEYAEGPSLDEYVKSSGAMHPDAVIRLASALVEAIAAIHAAGVTHRDLKPSNVLLTDSGPMVIDFGIAQTADSVSITRTGMAIGSPGYMAPEQITGHAGQEADLFTWAIIVAFAASGQPPYGTGQPAAILHRIISGSPDISAVPPRLMPLVQAALDQEPSRRPTATQLLQDLAPGALSGISPATALDPGMSPQTSLDRDSADFDRTRTMGSEGATRMMGGDGYPAGGYGQTGNYGQTAGYNQPTGYGPAGGYDQPRGYDRDPYDERRGSGRKLLGPLVAVVVLVGGGLLAWSLLSGSSTPGTPAGTSTSQTQTQAPAQQTQAPVQQTQAPTQAPATTAPAQTQAPTQAPTTQAPTTAPTSAPAVVPSILPSSAPASSAPAGAAAAPSASASG